MMREKVKDRAAIILSGMLPSDGEKAHKVKAAVDYAVMLEKAVDERVSEDDGGLTVMTSSERSQR